MIISNWWFFACDARSCDGDRYPVVLATHPSAPPARKRPHHLSITPLSNDQHRPGPVWGEKGLAGLSAFTFAPPFFFRGKGGSLRRPFVCISSHKLHDRKCYSLRDVRALLRASLLIPAAVSSPVYFQVCFCLTKSWRVDYSSRLDLRSRNGK